MEKQHGEAQQGQLAKAAESGSRGTVLMRQFAKGKLRP